MTRKLMILLCVAVPFTALGGCDEDNSDTMDKETDSGGDGDTDGDTEGDMNTDSDLDPDTAPKASIDRFSAEAGTLMVRETT